MFKSGLFGNDKYSTTVLIFWESQSISEMLYNRTDFGHILLCLKTKFGSAKWESDQKHCL
jgi:hypothetical protein